MVFTAIYGRPGHLHVERYMSSTCQLYSTWVYCKYGMWAQQVVSPSDNLAANSHLAACGDVCGCGTHLLHEGVLGLHRSNTIATLGNDHDIDWWKPWLGDA
jgi:hypothetical protein